MALFFETANASFILRPLSIAPRITSVKSAFSLVGFFFLPFSFAFFFLRLQMFCSRFISSPCSNAAVFFHLFITILCVVVLFSTDKIKLTFTLAVYFRLTVVFIRNHFCFGFMTGSTDNHNNCVIQFSILVRSHLFAVLCG